MLAGWRLSLRRTRVDWPIVAAAWLISLLATVLFAAGPIYTSAAALAGLGRTLDDAPAADASVQISLYGTPAEIAGVDGSVQSDLQAALSPLRAPIIRDGRSSATLALPPETRGREGDQAVLSFLDGLPGHAQLVEGTWPEVSSRTEALQVVLLDAAASDLGLAVGDNLDLSARRSDESGTVPVRLVGIFSIDDATDPYWYGDEQLTTGIRQTGGHRVLGPFLTTADGILGNATLSSVHMRWRALPDFGGLSVDNVAGVRARLDALRGRLQELTDGSLSVVTGLPAILASAERSLLVTRTQMLLLMAQLAIMAAYAILLTASLLVDHRRVETALLRSRGAGPVQIAWLALAEGALLVVPAVLVAPWLAVAEATVLNVVGPLADIGLSIEPKVTTDSYVLAGAAGLLCLAMLVLPAFLSARSFAAEERDLSRQETRTLGQRLGLDAVLLAVSAIALWQLRLYGAPLTRTVQGSLGFDPLLVAAPAVGLLAGGIIALRLLPLLAAGFESWISRGREVVASLGSRELARRPLRYTRTALLLILAVSLGVFALSYSATWSGSQQDQAVYQAGADVRTVVANRPGGTALLPAAYTGLPGVQAAIPVERISGGGSLAAARVDLLALNADTAASVVRLRGDETTQPFDELMRSLRVGRPTPQLVILPEDAAYLRVVPLVDIRRIVVDQFGEDPMPLDPAALVDVALSATAIVRDTHGLLFRLESDRVSVVNSAAEIVLPLAPQAAPGNPASPRAGDRFGGPLELAGLELGLSLPMETLTTDAALGVAGLSVAPSADGPWADLPLDGWAARMAPGRNVLRPVASVDGMVVQVDGTGDSILYGGSSAGRVLFISDAIDSLKGPIPVLANGSFLNASGTALGDAIDLTLEGARWRVSIAGTVDTFPTTDPTQPLLVFDQPALGLLRAQPRGAVRDADEWWMALEPGTSAQVTEALSGEPFNSAAVVSAADLTRSLSTDPVALGLIGALLLGFVATGFFALVALVVSAAVSARQRRTEFALLRALGMSAGQLSGWLWLENGSLVLASLVAGTVVGVVMSWIALPFITVTQQAASPVPGIAVHLPWDRILVLDLVVLVALGIAVAILATVLRRIGVGTILRMGED